MLSAVFYFLYFAAFGVYIPYWTLYLKHLHLSPVQIATIYSIPSIARIFLPPIYGYFADRFQDRKTILRFTAIGQIIPLLLLFRFHTYQAILLLISFFSLFNAAVLPFTEATVQEEQEKGKLDYGRTRLWGTLSFILLAATFGKVIERFHHGWVLYGFVFFLFALSILSFYQPSGKMGFEFQRDDVNRILRNKTTWIFLASVFLMHVSQGAYYGFFSIHLSELGFRDSSIGIQWAAAAASELLIFFFASHILGRFSFGTFISYLFIPRDVTLALDLSSPILSLAYSIAGHARLQLRTLSHCLHETDPYDLSRRISFDRPITVQQHRLGPGWCNWCSS